MKHIIMIAITLLLAHPSVNAGFPAKEMYDFAKLQQEKTRYQRKINEFYQRVLLLQLDRRDQAALSGVVTLDFPLVSESLLSFYSKHGSQATVVLPVSSLLFLEDLTTAFAWLHVNGYSGETVEEYITMLKYKDASEFPGNRYPTPLEALYVPQDALSDKQVDILGLRLRNTAYAFIILHELAHILYRHRSYSQISTEQARAQEAEADQFALRTLERADNTIPAGIIVFFAAQVNYFPNRGQFLAEKRSEREWQRYIQESQTHPLTTERLKGIARYLDGWARRANANEADTLNFIATRLFKMAEGYDDPEMQDCLAVVADRADPKALAPRKHGSKAEVEKLLFQHCHKQ